jgi:hypothetical protein
MEFIAGFDDDQRTRRYETPQPRIHPFDGTMLLLVALLSKSCLSRYQRARFIRNRILDSAQLGSARRGTIGQPLG